MATTLTDLPELLAGIPDGAWVAISERQRKVLAWGPDAEEVLSRARTAGEDLPLIVRVPEQNSALFV